ncbi:hypothetical protein QR685DRAFT_148140 [Neurospora intermedia]|uniref:Transmembrane protein n=1 Tax=Neurospora intermedia TaxID=5142 RepID=A0ABR3CXB0_NEUIN
MAILNLLKFLATLPYQRLYIYNTVRPAQEIEEVANLDTEVAENRKAQLAAIAAWRTGKRDELSFVAVAAAVMTAIITGSFSWDIVKTSHWTGRAFWYTSLSLCISAIFLASQQLSLLSLIHQQKKDLEKCDDDDDDDDDAQTAKVVIRRHLEQILTKTTTQTQKKQKRRRYNKPHLPAADVEGGRHAEKAPSNGAEQAGTATEPKEDSQRTWVLSSRRTFVWQCSIMLIAYSTVFYLAGLSVVVCTTVFDEKGGDESDPWKWDADSKVAVTYLVSLGISVFLFGFCSYGAYDYIYYEYDDDASRRSFVQEIARRLSILARGKDPMKKRSALVAKQDARAQV